MQERGCPAVVSRTNDQEVRAANEVLKPRTGWYDGKGRDPRSHAFGARSYWVSLTGRTRQRGANQRSGADDPNYEPASHHMLLAKDIGFGATSRCSAVGESESTAQTGDATSLAT